MPTLLLALRLLPVLAIAGPPFSTDDPVPVELHHWEIYFASALARTSSSTSGTLPHIDMNYGLAPNIHVHMQTPMAFSAQSGQRSQYGYGDTEFGAKIRLLEERKGLPQVAIYPAVDIPTGAATRGLGSGSTRYFFPVWLQRTFGDWACFGGVGYWRNPGAGNRDYWFSGAVVQHQQGKLLLGAELFHTTAAAVDDSSHTGFNLGAVYDISDDYHLMLSLGRDLSGGTNLYGYVALQWTFGPEIAKTP